MIRKVFVAGLDGGNACAYAVPIIPTLTTIVVNKEMHLMMFISHTVVRGPVVAGVPSEPPFTVPLVPVGGYVDLCTVFVQYPDQRKKLF